MTTPNDAPRPTSELVKRLSLWPSAMKGQLLKGLPSALESDLLEAAASLQALEARNKELEGALIHAIDKVGHRTEAPRCKAINGIHDTWVEEEDCDCWVKEARTALRTALDHIEHMAKWIGQHQHGYSFESLGEDMPGMRAVLSAKPAQGGEVLQKRPVAFRVRDYADGWILFHDEAAAKHEAKQMGGALMQGLYVLAAAPPQPIPTPDEALREALEKIAKSRQAGRMGFVEPVDVYITRIKKIASDALAALSRARPEEKT